MKPWLLETAAEYNGKVKIVAVDVDKSGDLAQSYGIKAMPTFVLLKGEEEIGRLEGGHKERIISMITDAL